jgi:hypothetical protein
MVAVAPLLHLDLNQEDGTAIKTARVPPSNSLGVDFTADPSSRQARKKVSRRGNWPFRILKFCPFSAYPGPAFFVKDC